MLLLLGAFVPSLTIMVTSGTLAALGRRELASIGCSSVQLRDTSGESWRCGTKSKPWLVLFDDAPDVAEVTLL